jgi:hypothetical protein
METNMTDTELATAVFERLTLRETEAKAAGDKKRIVALAKAHKALEKVWADLHPAMGIAGPVVFSGGLPKPD